MASVPKGSEPPRRRRPLAKTPEARERQLTSAALDLIEKQILEGTASAQILIHYARQSAAKTRLEERKTEAEIALLEAKKEDQERGKRIETLYDDALKAMRRYQGQDVENNYED